MRILPLSLLCAALSPATVFSAEYLMPAGKPLLSVQFPEAWEIMEDGAEDENWIEAIREEEVEVKGREETESISGLFLLHFATASGKAEAVKASLAEIASGNITYKKEDGKPFKGLINGRNATGMDWLGTNSSGKPELISHRIVELEGGDVAVFLYIRGKTSEPHLTQDYEKIVKSIKSLRHPGKGARPAPKKPA